MKSLWTLVVVVVVQSQVANFAMSQNVVTDAAGNRYEIPAGWTTKQITGGLRIYPKDAQGQESYLIIRYRKGFTKADGESLRKKFGTMANTIAPFLKLTGEKWLRGPKGDVLLLDFTGNDSNGVARRIRFYLGSVGNGSIAVMSAGHRSLLQKRDKDLRNLFVAAISGKSIATDTPAKRTTARPAIGARDSQVVGRWVRQTGAGSSGGGYVASSTTYTFTFLANGTCSLNIRTWVSASAGGSSAFAGPGRGTTYIGRWTASNGKLFIQYKNGTTLRNNYKVFLHFGKPVLKLFLPGGKPVYYKK